MTNPPAANPTDSSAPPTSPGVVEGRGPLQKLAAWALGLGIVSMVVPPLGVVAIILGIIALTRPNRSPGTATVGIVLGAVGIAIGAIFLMMFWVMATSLTGVQSLIQDQELARLHGAITTTAIADAAPPEHPAALLLDERKDLEELFWSMTGSRNIRPGLLLVGDYDLVRFDPSSDREVQALRAAIDGLDAAAPTWTLGDVCFVRLPSATQNAGLVYAWRLTKVGGYGLVITDDGTVHRLRDDEWRDIWSADAESRQALDLPPFTAPPMPGDE